MTLSILWADGFDNFNNVTDLATLYANTGFWDGFVAGRTDGKAIYGHNGSLTYQNLGSESDLTLAIAVNLNSSQGGVPTFTFGDVGSGDVLATFDFSNTNLLKFTCASGTYQTAIPLLPNGNWSHLQMRVQSGASGSYSVVLNGSTTIASGSGLNITGSSGAITTMNSVSASGGLGLILDDLMICTGGFPGDCRLQTDFPISNAAVQFTPLANANWQEVSETAMDGDTSYNSSSTVGQTDTFNFTPISIPAGSTIIGCFIRTAASKTDAGTRSLQNKMVSGSNSSLGAAVGLSTSYEYQQDNFSPFLSGLGLLNETGINGTTAGYTLAA